MKLLFDENLSPKLVKLLSDLFPDSVHVRDVGLNRADDIIVWEYAQDSFASKVRNHSWTQSVPPRGSGWVNYPTQNQ